MAKKDDKKTVKTDDKHGAFYDEVQVDCICGNTFAIGATMPGPFKTEVCYACHQAYNKDRVVKKVVKGRMEQFLEKQKKMNSIKK